LLMLRRADFLQLIHRVPAIAVALLGELAARLRRTDEQVGGLALLDVHNRVARTLLHLAASRGEESDEGLVIKQRLTHQQLANMAGTTRETVTRVLKQLERDGYIRASGRHLVVLKGSSEALAEDGLGSTGLEDE
ncbi:MAG: Crp/Fnr family transcriptional regulator, partial [Gemmatimonadota bacterium]